MEPTKDKLIKGRIYRLQSRNLHFGVYLGGANFTYCFLGIREKLGARYLFQEHGHDDPAQGTVRSWIDTGIEVPSDIELTDDLGTVDQITGRPVDFNRKPSEREGWYFVDTKEYSHDIVATRVSNSKLFDFMLEVELQDKIKNLPPGIMCLRFEVAISVPAGTDPSEVREFVHDEVQAGHGHFLPENDEFHWGDHLVATRWLREKK